jgi:hypothetical protein
MSPNNCKALDFENLEEEGELRDKAWGQSPWSSKRKGLGPREQERCGKARSVKLQGCQPRFGPISGENSWGFPKGMQPQRWPSPCVTKPMVGSHSSGLTPHGEVQGCLKASDGKVIDFESLGRLGAGEAVWGGTNIESATLQKVGNLYITPCSWLSQLTCLNRAKLLAFVRCIIECAIELFCRPLK